MANILLLRSPTQDAPDPYEDCFKDLGYRPSSLPVLETVFTNFEDLKRTIVTGPAAHDFAGVIITSARACEAWAHVVEYVMQVPPDQTASWSSTPFYVVGEATAKALAAIGDVYGAGPLAPKDIRGGPQTGSSERLAHFILNDLPDKEEKRLLYLTGDKNRDTLPKILDESHVKLQSLQVYKTQGSSQFAKDLERVIKATSADSDPWWIVFFAPSAAEFAVDILRQSFDLPAFKPSEDVSTTKVELAAIGPTTFTFLRDNLKLRVAVCSPKPAADALAIAIKSYDTRPPVN